MYIHSVMVFQVQPPTVEQLSVIAMDKSVREEILIPAVSKHFTFICFSFSLYHFCSHLSLMLLSGEVEGGGCSCEEEDEVEEEGEEDDEENGGRN